MAKSTGLENLFESTEAAEIDVSDLEEGNIQSTGVGLRQGEINALNEIGADLGGISRNALIRFAVRKFLIEYRMGKVDLSSYVQVPEKPKPSLKLPGQ